MAEIAEEIREDIEKPREVGKNFWQTIPKTAAVMIFVMIVGGIFAWIRTHDTYFIYGTIIFFVMIVTLLYTMKPAISLNELIAFEYVKEYWYVWQTQERFTAKAVPFWDTASKLEPELETGRYVLRCFGLKVKDLGAYRWYKAGKNVETKDPFLEVLDEPYTGREVYKTPRRRQKLEDPEEYKAKLREQYDRRQ